MFKHGHLLELPPDLEVAKKSLVSASSSLYAMSLIVACIVFTSTEVVTSKVPLDFFESFGFYTYLYSVSVAFMLYLFLYVLRVKYYQESSTNGGMVGSKHKDDDFDVGDFIRRMTQATGLDVKEVNRMARTWHLFPTFVSFWIPIIINSISELHDIKILSPFLNIEISVKKKF